MSEWPAIAITGVVTLVASLSAVFIKERFDRRRAVKERRETAYARLATAVGVFLLRVEVFRGDLSWRRAMGESVMTNAALVMAGLYALIPKRWSPPGVGALDLARLARVPEPRIRSEDSYQAMLDALAVVVDARTEVELVGTRAVITAASELIDACVVFGDAPKPSWPWQLPSTQVAVARQRKAVLDARDRYIGQVRSAERSHSRWPSRRRERARQPQAQGRPGG